MIGEMSARSAPNKTNGNDCGIYVVKGIEQLTKGPMLHHSPEDITAFGMTIAEAILKNELEKEQAELPITIFELEETDESEEEQEMLLGLDYSKLTWKKVGWEKHKGKMRKLNTAGTIWM